METMTLGEVAKACNGVLSDQALAQVKVNNIVIDSRQIKKGYLYIPIIGKNNDGHAYISSAFGNGAVCTLTQQAVNYPHIQVKSTFMALKDIAAYYRTKFSIPVIALTGSVGKTTAKEMLAAVLSAKYCVLKTAGNFNNEYGVPQTVFRIENKHDVAVLELGMNSFGEIARLSKITRPDIAMILNIGTAHIGRLGDRKGILKAKTEIFDHMKKDGKAYVNGDDDQLILLKDTALNPVLFGKQAHNSAKLDAIKKETVYGTQFVASYKGITYDAHVAEPGQHMAYATLAAIAIAADMGLTKGQIQEGIKAYQPADGRMKVSNLKSITLIDGSYNASQESILAGLDVLRLAQGRKVAILGDVREMDEHEIEGHIEMGKDVAQSQADIAVFVGKLAKHMYQSALKVMQRNAHYFKTQDEMVKALPDILKPKDTVFIKASNGIRLKDTVVYLKQNF